MTPIKPYPLIARWGRLIPGFGYGRCHRCLRPWWSATWHDVPTGDASACFAMCDRCWQRTDTMQRLVAYRALMDGWLLNGADIDTVNQRWKVAATHIVEAKEHQP